MERFVRIYELNRILQAARRPVSHKRLEEELGCSRATVTRLIEDMRLYLNAPIEYDREHNGYYYDRRESPRYELPGLWLNPSELHALLSVQELLGAVQPGLLEAHLKPLQRRIAELLRLRHASSDEVPRRIRILQVAARAQGACFQTVAGALAQRQRLWLRHYNRASDEHSERLVSPQRLTYYRDNWYLDAWCHLREALRTFALDAIEAAEARAEPAQEVAEAELDAHLGAAYGIFAGAATEVAVLRFTPQRARWVSQERWHPQQEGRWLGDGGYELRIPYANPLELVMDVLKYGPDVEVIAPDALRSAVAERLRAATERYAPSPGGVTASASGPDP